MIDTLKDFALSPDPVGTFFLFAEIFSFSNPYIKQIADKYYSYADSYDATMEKVGGGEYTVMDSEDALEYLKRSRFTNE